MNAGQQLRDGVFRPPYAITLLRGRAWLWAGLYLILSGAMLMCVARWITNNQGTIGQWVLDYLFPKSLHGAGEMLFELYLKDQSRVVLLNGIVTGALLLVSVTLFPVKEQLSKAFETDRRLTGEPISEHPLWYQGLEELKLVLLYVTAQMVILKIGYGPEEWRKPLSVGLSTTYLACTVAIDFIASTLQRHKMKYSSVIKTLIKRPVASLGFGLVFSTPALIVTAWSTKTDADFGYTLTVLFGVQVVAIVWAAIGGTWLGAALLPDCKKVPQSSAGARTTAWALTLVIFGWHSYVYGAVGLAAHHKSQLLKCDYSVDWRSISLERPSLGSLLGGEVSVGVSMDVEIHNPTEFDVSLEDTKLKVHHEKDLLAESTIDPVSVPAGETRTQPLRFRLKLDASKILKGRELLSDHYSLTLLVDVAAGVQFPIYLRHKQ